MEQAILCLGPPMYVPSQVLQLLPTLPDATAITHMLLLLPALPAALTHARPLLLPIRSRLPARGSSCYYQPFLLLLPPHHQVQAASPRLIVLDTIWGWGVNGSLVTLLPDQPLPPSAPPAYSSTVVDIHLSPGSVAGIAVGGAVVGAVLLGLVMLLLLQRCVHVYVRRWLLWLHA